MEIAIAKYSTYFSVRCSEDLLIANGIYISKFVNNKLTEYEYEPIEKKFTPSQSYFYHDKENKIMSMPINILTQFTQFVVSKNCTYKIFDRPPNESNDIKINFKPKFKDKERQIPVIQYLSDISNPYKALKLQTGVGKTYCVIKALSKIKKKAMIVLPNSLTSQWCEEIVDKTDVKLNEIMIIQGGESIAAIFKNPSIVDDIKIFVMSSKTLVQYAGKEFEIYNTIPQFKEFIKLIRVGVKVTDECHLLFHGNTLIDLNCNVEQNIYLSATYVRSNQSANRIFNIIFPEHLKYDDKKYNRYVNVTECLYSLGYIHPMAARNKRGYNQIKYEKWLLKDQNRQNCLYKEVFDPLIQHKFIDIKNPNEKLIIFITLKITGYRLCAYIQKRYPYLKVATFFNESDETILKKADIIVTTIGSCGTGKDVKNLRSVFLFVSFVSEGLSYQVLGRLRELRDVTPEFVFMQNMNVPEHLHHLTNRRRLYKTLCNNYGVLKYNYQ